MSVSGGFGICDNDPWEVGGCDVVTVVRNVGTTVSPIVVLPKVVLKRRDQFLYIKRVGDGDEESKGFSLTFYLVVIVGSVVMVDSTTFFSMDEE